MAVWYRVVLWGYMIYYNVLFWTCVIKSITMGRFVWPVSTPAEWQVFVSFTALLCLALKGIAEE